MYIGVKNNLKRRLSQHYNNQGNKQTFAGRYNCFNLVYFEHYTDINGYPSKVAEYFSKSTPRPQRRTVTLGVRTNRTPSVTVRRCGRGVQAMKQLGKFRRVALYSFKSNYL